MTDILTIDIEAPATEEAPQYDAPDGSKWLLGVDMDHTVFVVKAPNVHPSFFDGGRCAEGIGFEPVWGEVAPGLYDVVVSFHTSEDWETGAIDDWGFDIKEFKKVCP